MQKTIDGKPVRKFLYIRYVPTLQRNHPVEVEAFNRDHAMARLQEHYSYWDAKGWDFVDELNPEHTVGRMGETLLLNPRGLS